MGLSSWCNMYAHCVSKMTDDRVVPACKSINELNRSSLL